MHNFLNTPTANPMHNTLRRAVETLDSHMQEAVTKSWDAFFACFQERCAKYIEKRPQQGLYTTGAWSIISACYHMDDIVQDANSCQAFRQLSANVGEMLPQYENVDMRVGMYWYSFAEQYGSYMTHCNNRVMEDFQREVAKTACKEYIHNPDTDIQLTALAAVQQATIAIARAHPQNTGIGEDMTRVSKIATEQRAMTLQAPLEVCEPRDYVDNSDEPSQDEIDLEEVL